MQGSNGETDIENRLMDTGRVEERVRYNGKSNMESSITGNKIDSQLEFVVLSQGTQTGALYQPRWVGRGGRWEAVSKGRGYMFICG